MCVCVCVLGMHMCVTVPSFARAEAMAAEIKELQGEMADINTVRFFCV